MKDIYGRPISGPIPFRPIGPYEPRFDWPEETAVSAGKGIVFKRGGGTYRTLFMEVYPPGASFIRGEGETPEECERSCWEQYQRALHCIEDREHEWEPRGYKNGAGLCKHCGTFHSECFTGADLGQFCHVCGVGTTWQFKDDQWACEAHAVHEEGERYLISILSEALDPQG